MTHHIDLSAIKLISGIGQGDDLCVELRESALALFDRMIDVRVAVTP